MNPSELTAIVNLVTQQVLAAMGQGDHSPCPQQDGLARLLVVGEPAVPLPEELCRDAVVLDLEDYRQHQNILRYDRVVIAALETTQLADLALARAADDATGAVLQALLQGIDTYMLDSALSFRRYAGRGSTALYQLLENYARTLEVFGVKMAGQKPKQVLAEPKPPKYKAPAVVAPKGSGVPNASRLITETEAGELLKGGSPVTIPAGAIVTPLARDLFARSGAELLWQR